VCVEDVWKVLVIISLSLADIKDFTNEALSKDKESRKQFVFKLFRSANDNVIQPKETKTTSIWLQAPYQKGRKEIKMMIYYSMPANYPKLK
jgi:trafficking protein particle complex subunit 8